MPHAFNSASKQRVLLIWRKTTGLERLRRELVPTTGSVRLLLPSSVGSILALGAVVVAVVFLCSGCAGQVPPPSPPGSPPPGTVLHKVLRVYPSARLPPVSDPYLFYSDSGPVIHYSQTVVNAQGPGDAQHQAELMRLGKLPVFWAYGPQWPYGKNKQAFIDYYLGSIHPNQAVLIDEWQAPQQNAPPNSPLAAANPYGLEGSIEGIAQAKRRDPGALVLVAWTGQNSLLPLVRKGGVDYILIEAYTNMPKSAPASWGIRVFGVDRRIAKARSWGMISQTIPWLGEFYPPEKYRFGDVLTVKKLERQIRHYRRIAPEMPGLAFYAGAEDSVLARAASNLARKYFIEPAPSVRIVSPSDDRVLSRAPHTITASAAAKDGRTVAEYKGYIDNQLVYVGRYPSFTWDFAEESPGTHFITVHAIDSGWNRAAAQIKVVCK